MTRSEKRRAITEAINGKKQISFTYRDETRSRLGNPHAMGFDSTGSDKVYVRFYQTGGQTSSEIYQEDSEGRNFRLFLLDDMDSIELRRTEFEPHQTFTCCDSAIDWKRFPNRQVEDDCSC